ncbi:MAG: type I restriction enzyme HsdR N-terminal domain-containing protein [bacterium]|nr:type I restriction enzyme HsdR N-terminal domain-containing protein [bacterium]
MIPKRVGDRLTRSINKFQQILKLAKDRDVNESDTVSIIKDMLAEVFGYDKYLEVTSEFAVRGTYCDLAIKINSKTEFLIEVKAIGIGLKESHLRQAIEYAANNGAQWVILTSGLIWQVYKIRFEKPINYDLVCEFSFAELDPKNEEHLERLFILCKEGLAKDAREDFHEKTLTVNRFILGALMLSDEVVSTIRRELRKISEGVLVTPEEIIQVLSNEVIKREVLDGEEAAKAQGRVRRFYGKATRRTKESLAEESPTEEKPSSKSEEPTEPGSQQNG